MVAISEQRTARTIRGKEPFRHVSVVDSQDKASRQLCRRRLNPGEGVKVHLHTMALFKLMGIPRHISGNRGVADGARFFAEVVALGDDVDFLEAPLRARDHVNRKCVNEFIGEKASGGRSEFIEIGEQPNLVAGDCARQPGRDALTLQGARLLNGHIVERRGELRQ